MTTHCSRAASIAVVLVVLWLLSVAPTWADFAWDSFSLASGVQ
jgi:hypothetical protein